MPIGVQPDLLMFFGDLNYRVNGFKESIIEAMSLDYFDVLFNNDQLMIERQLGNIPKFLEEGKVEFAPTFKRKKYDNSQYGMKRNPSWTDRILYSSKREGDEMCKLELKSYDANNLIDISDHRPVCA